MHPAIPLGVPLMDADHAVIEAMFARAAESADADLVTHYHAIETEVVAHFAREEALMKSVGAPVLACHETQHRLLLAEFARARPAEGAVDATALRAALATLAGFVEGHVASVDRVTSQFLAGALDATAVAALRLPESAA